MSKPWETEPDRVDFEAEGLPCAMRRGYGHAWCGYVGVGQDHPLYGLPKNHPLKLPKEWFDNRRISQQGFGPLDLFIQVMSGKELDEACPIGLAFEVHGGVNYANHRDDGDPDLWWFGFDCGHAGDLVPAMLGQPNPVMDALLNTLPKEVRGSIRGQMARVVYRDQQYVVGECQSLAAQLQAIVPLIKENADADSRNRKG